MALRRKTQKRDAQLAFDALAIEGGLLSPEWLTRVAQLQAGDQSEPDYRIPKGLNLRDDIGRYWRIAQAYWNDFASGMKSGAETKIIAERFVTSLLRESFGFGTLAPASSIEIAGRVYPVGYSALGRRVPVIIAPAATGLDTPAPAFGDGSRRRSAFGLAQELVNADDESLWALVSDGATLRILRDNASLTRPAWIEADLARIFTEERYADFTALWLLLHETRFGKADRPPSECILESWRNAGREEGTRAREQLRKGVEDALLAFGNGFLVHPDNQTLRVALQNGSLTTKDYFQQLLRLVYRLIFLLTAEERGLLHSVTASDASKELYAQGYGMQRLRARSVKRSAFDRFSDLWEAVKIVFRGLAKGEELLGLPALAGLFAPHQCSTLDAARVENRFLLTAVFRLSWLKEDSSLSRVNWRDMGPEELGSVYESLLELVPQITQGGRVFGFATGSETKGHARKLTGSYYTPDSLVQVLLDSALEPVVQQTLAANPQNQAEALLQLSIVDPACGSGHFLLAAARRLGSHLARVQANGTPSAAQYRQAVRQVVGRCIYGVDLNPMAVELCKVSLWMEAVEPGKPLSFLNSHIREGNALMGATLELMKNGVPEAAWEPIEGDDKKIATALKKKNKKAAGGQRGFDFSAPSGSNESAAVAKAVADLDAASDAELETLERKESQWQGILDSAAYQHQRFVADAWCAAFVWPKQAGDLAEAAPTNELFFQIRDGQGRVPELTKKTVEELRKQYHFFHWFLAFPQVFARGGFDVVLGNPPWERVKLQEQEFFASRSDVIANAANAAARKKLIATLPETDPVMWKEWCAASREAEGQSHFVRQSARYPLCGKGDVNTYALFAEHNRSLLGPKGRAGFIVPTGIATDDTTKDYFGTLIECGQLASLFDFENTAGAAFFKGVGHGNIKFCLLALSRTFVSSPELMFYGHGVQELQVAGRRFRLSNSDINALNPNTRTCPTFRSQRDADINLAIYRHAGILWRENDGITGNPWRLRFMAMLHMANDSVLFKSRAELESIGCELKGNRFASTSGEFIPLVEAKMIHHFDHRFGDYTDRPDGVGGVVLPLVPDERKQHADYAAFPQYWVAATEVETRLAGKWPQGWLLGWRDITRAVDQRTIFSSLIPRAATGDTFLLAMPEISWLLVASLYGNLCSFALDYAARQKVGGTHLKYHVLKQLPVLPPSTYTVPATWSREMLLRDWILPRVLELTYTAWDLEAFGKDVGYDGPPFKWDPARRFLLRVELDAAFFHLYGISRDDADYIMDTFPIVRKNDEKAHGEYRTKRVILEVYDELAEAIRTGKTYVTRLDPPPADPRVAHPLNTKPEWAQAEVTPDAKPSVELRSLPDGAWAMPPGVTDENLTLFALIDVLRHLPAPVSSEHVLHAVTVVRYPAFALAFMSEDERSNWIRVIGHEAQQAQNVQRLDDFRKKLRDDRAWGDAVNHLKATEALVVDPQTGTWAAGPQLPQSSGESWVEGRASIAAGILAKIGDAQAEQNLTALVRRGGERGRTKKAVR